VFYGPDRTPHFIARKIRPTERRALYSRTEKYGHWSACKRRGSA